VVQAQATGNEPYPYQTRFACGDWRSVSGVPVPLGFPMASRGEGLLVDVPTSMGKTAMAVLGWLWSGKF
jgi:hypothetical protein